MNIEPQNYEVKNVLFGHSIFSVGYSLFKGFS